MKTCKTCKNFKRGKWHKVIDPLESERLGGSCPLLLSVLKMENSEMIWMEDLAIQDTFGCIFYKEQ